MKLNPLSLGILENDLKEYLTKLLNIKIRNKNKQTKIKLKT